MAALSILVFTSFSALLVCCTSLPRYEKESTSSSAWPFSVMAGWSPGGSPMLSTLVLSPLILIPHRVQALSRASIICCSSFLFSATRVRSSAYRAFWMQVVNGVLSLYDRNSPPLVVYSTCRPPLVISMASLTILSMKQLNRRGDSTQPCLTPVFTSKFSDVPSAVLTQHHVPVYSSLMMSISC